MVHANGDTIETDRRQPDKNGHGKDFNTTTSAKQYFATRLIHDGSEASEETGAVQPAISLSTTFKQQSVGVHKVGRPKLYVA